MRKYTRYCIVPLVELKRSQNAISDLLGLCLCHQNSLFVIVMLSWSVFWMSDEPFAGRSRISATGVLTIVAYQFVLAEGLPRVAYLTLLDKLMIVSFGLLAVTVLESLLVSRHPRGSAAALRIDRAARWVFPVAYVAMIFAVFQTSG